MAFSFGSSTTKPALTLGGTTTTTTNTTQGSSLFAGLGPKQTTTATSTAAAPATSNSSGSLFLGLGAKQDTTPSTNLFSQTTNTNNNTSTANPAQPTLNTSTLTSGGPQIDIAHLRSTTKYDHLTPQLQSEILALDTAILNQIRQCTDVSDLLPSVTNAGSQLTPAIEYVGSKLEELELGLENDADAIVGLRDGDVRKDEGEAKCVFRTVDRLKVPRQYQVGSAAEVGAVPGAAFNGGLSGWWNQPQTFRGSSIRGAAGAGASVLVDEELDDDRGNGPKNLVELLDERTREMGVVSGQHKRLLAEIEDFVGSLEDKVYAKERDLNERLDNGITGVDGALFQQERDHQMQLLRFVFGEVQRNLYEVAEKIGSTRDEVVELGFNR